MMRSLRFHPARLLAAMLLAATSGCAESDAAKVERAERNLHEQLRQSKFAEIYRQTSPTLQSSETEEEFVAKLREIGQRTGEIVSIEKADDATNVASQKSPAGRTSYVQSIYLVKGKSRSCYEVSLWMIEGGEARLLAYDCLSSSK
ncbi:MAG TPA: hypothetical protein VN256_08790 [Pyrinomonadaceae bacterium]|nr:hypothetical protein [Pyrinomonadaceae bacterium]